MRIPVLIYIFTLLLSGCLNILPSTMSKQKDRLVEQQAQYKHKVIEHLPIKSNELTIYIEGDGRPWLNGNAISSDPTPKHRLALSLMYLDKGNAIYLGRPCYFQTNDPKCHYSLWTYARYSNPVIQSMTDVTLTYIEQLNVQRITLVGYSGGAVLATMMACRMGIQTRLITIAGNLNVKAWTEYHEYSDLYGSLDPYLDFQPCPQVKQYHFAGGKDKTVPLSVTRSFTEKFSQTLTIIEDADHVKWPKYWLDIESSID